MDNFNVVNPIKNDDNAELECRNTDKKLFFNALSDLCENWKRTIPEASFYEVLFKFDMEVIIPELKKHTIIKIKTRS